MIETALFGFDLETFAFWHWWILAAGCFVLEVLIMGFFFLWLGLAAACVGSILALVPMPWTLQCVLWAVLSLSGAVGWRVYKAKNPNPIATDEPFLNKRGAQYIGRVFTLEEPIVNGFGRIKVEDSYWKVSCPRDVKSGHSVQITGLKDTVFEVTPQDG